MKGAIFAGVVAAGLGALSAAPAQALGPVPSGVGASEPLVTQAMTAARARRLYMMQQIQRQQAYGYRRGYGGYGGGYGRGYGGGYGGYRGGYGGGGYGYGPPRGGYYGY